MLLKNNVISNPIYNLKLICIWDNLNFSGNLIASYRVLILIHLQLSIL